VHEDQAGPAELQPAVGKIDHHGGQGGPPGVPKAKSLTLVVSPSARQSGEFLRKATEFARRLGIKPKGDGDNEISLELPNHSRIVGCRAPRRPCGASRRCPCCWWTRRRG